MARLRQLNPNNYRTTDRIDQDFQNIVRYIQAAELGDKTLAELLMQLFDDDGVWDGPIELRLDSSAGLQYRVGEYTDPTIGWIGLAALADLRGAAGQDLGQIGQPVMYGRTEFTATASQTVFSIATEADEDVVVFQNGLLLQESDYTVSTTAVTLDTGATVGDIIEVLRIRDETDPVYRRSDQVAAASQAVFPFSHTSAEDLQVYQNGLLLRPGGSNDYVSDSANNTVTLMSSATENDTISILVVNSSTLTTVSGLMLEENFLNSGGLIPYAKLSIADGDIPQAKINGLTTLLQNRGRLFVSASTPTGMVAGDLWLDTSVSPNVLKVYDSVNWLALNTEVDIPDYTSANALQFLRVNGTGTAIEWANVDVSTLVPKSFMAAANGVASLDANGVVPIAQIPEIFALQSYYDLYASTVSNGNRVFKRIYKQRIRIDAISHKLASGTCTIQLTVDGTPVGSTHSVTSTRAESNLASSIEVDATSVSKEVGYVITSASTPADLDVTISIAVLTA